MIAMGGCRGLIPRLGAKKPSSPPDQNGGNGRQPPPFGGGGGSGGGGGHPPFGGGSGGKGGNSRQPPPSGGPQGGTPGVTGRMGIVTGLVMEGRLLPTHNPRVIACCMGPGPAAAGRATWMVMEHGARLIVSFGTAGGLSPALTPGTLILPTEIRNPEGQAIAAVDTRLRTALHNSLHHAGQVFAEGPLVGSDVPVLTPRAKTLLAAESGALAVDMETHRVASIAQDAGLPFIAVRVIADPAERAIPPWALKGINEKGATRVAPILAALAAAPWRVGAVLHLARDSGAARDTLRHVAAGPLLDLLALAV